MPFDAQSAKQAGYSDAEIADYLGTQSKFDVAGARQAGYGDGEIIAHLSGGDQPVANPPGADAYAARHSDKSPLRTVDAAGRGAADMLSFGFGDELAAAADAVPALIKGGPQGYSQAYRANVADQRAIDAADKQDHPIARGAGEVSGFLGSLGTGAIVDLGQFVPRLVKSGRGLPGAVENALRSAGAGSIYGGLAAAGNGQGGIDQRAAEAVPGALVGGAIGAVASPIATMAGGAVNALRSRVAEPLDRAANALAGRFDVGAAQARAAELRAAGAVPTAVSAMDESGRGYVRATASRMTPSRELVQQRAEAAALNLPDRIAMQAEQHISPDPALAARAEADAASQIAANTTPPAAVNGDAGSQISARLNSDYDAAKAGVNQAYDAARAADPQAAHIPAAELPQVAANLRQAVSDFHPDDIPSVARELGGLDRTSTPTVRDLFELRQRLTGIRLAKPDQAIAAGRAVSALDQSINDLADRGVITGDPQVVDQWRQAIAARRQFGQNFEGNDLIAQLTERGYHGTGRTNVVAPEDASNLLLGRGGVSNSADTVRDLTRIRDRVGADSSEWQALQGEAVSRILGRDAGRTDYGRAWDQFASTNPQLAGLLMNPAQRAGLDAARANVSGAVADQGAVGAGRTFMTPGSADTFATGVNSLSPERLTMARSAAAREVQQRAGENVSAAPGVARKLAFAPEQQARNNALLGPDAAQRFQGSMAAEARTARDLQDVAPRSGSQTQLRSADSEAAAGAIDAAQTLIGGPKAWLGALVSRLKTAGVDDATAKAVADVATDPAQLDALLSRMERIKPGSSQALASIINQSAGRAAGAATQPQSPIEITVNRSTNPEFLAERQARGLPVN